MAAAINRGFFLNLQKPSIRGIIGIHVGFEEGSQVLAGVAYLKLFSDILSMRFDRSYRNIHLIGYFLIREPVLNHA